MQNSRSNRSQAANSSSRNRRSSPQNVSAPLASARIQRTNKPVRLTFGRNPGIRHSEMLGVVNGSVNFSADKYEINPGLVTTFPWLSNEALGYEQYKFHKLQFRVEANAPATVAGIVCVAADIDAADEAPSSEEAIMSYENAMSSAPWVSMQGSAPSGCLNKARFIRYSQLEDNLDIKTYDACNVFVTREGFADTSRCGKLVCDYEVEFMTPQVPSTSDKAHSYSLVSASTTLASPLSNPTEIGIIAKAISGTEIEFQVGGDYMLCLNSTGTNFTNDPTTVPGTAVETEGFAVSTGATYWYTFTGVSKGDTVDIDYTALAATVTGTQVLIAPFRV